MLKFRVIGQVDKKFIICSCPLSLGNELIAIDQHAADERIKVENLIHQFNQMHQNWKNGVADDLFEFNPPIDCNITIVLDLNQLDSLKEWGFHCHIQGLKNYVSHCPKLFADRMNPDILSKIIHTHVRWIDDNPHTMIPTHFLDILNSKACRYSNYF